MKKNWYAVYTKANCEIKAAALLTKGKIENYCPLNRIVISHGAKNKIVYEALFPSFVFVYAFDTEMHVIRRTGSVVNFVFWLGKPAIVKEIEIENIRDFADKYCNIKLEKAIVTGNNVRIIHDSPFDINNEIISAKDSKCRILLPSLGYTLVAEIKKSSIDVFNFSFERNEMVS